MYFRHFVAKQGTIVKDISFKVGAQFLSVSSPGGPICLYLQTDYLEGTGHAQIILLLLFTMNFFGFFYKSIFPKNCIFVGALA